MTLQSKLIFTVNTLVAVYSGELISWILFALIHNLMTLLFLGLPCFVLFGLTCAGTLFNLDIDKPQDASANNTGILRLVLLQL